MLITILLVYLVASVFLFFFLISLVRLHHGWIRRVDKDSDYYWEENKRKFREIEKYLDIEHKQGYVKKATEEKGE